MYFYWQEETQRLKHCSDKISQQIYHISSRVKVQHVMLQMSDKENIDSSSLKKDNPALAKYVRRLVGAVDAQDYAWRHRKDEEK